MYGEEPVLTCVTFLTPQQSWLEASSPKSVTLGALSLLQGTSPTYRQMRLAFGGRKVYVVLRQVQGEGLEMGGQHALPMGLCLT